ncbi:hypothetical protein EYF80_039927 [Liparis tanakae]|uniref:Uncharacterized protein n=1 Tax=Liparis tanakae TaxID=230148 RepID=A0A4Z2GA01_9TELE|nr:hypothetical protein EYF80_039927 [Liparis tanakae]
MPLICFCESFKDLNNSEFFSEIQPSSSSFLSCVRWRSTNDHLAKQTVNTWFCLDVKRDGTSDGKSEGKVSVGVVALFEEVQALRLQESWTTSSAIFVVFEAEPVKTALVKISLKSHSTFMASVFNFVHECVVSVSFDEGSSGAIGRSLVADLRNISRPLGDDTSSGRSLKDERGVISSPLLQGMRVSLVSISSSSEILSTVVRYSITLVSRSGRREISKMCSMYDRLSGEK